MGARALGMGRAVTAFAGQESAFWNPAGLARMEKGRLMVMARNDLLGDATAFSLILARQPVGTVTFSYQFLDLGTQDYVDEAQNVLGVFSNRDHLGIVSFAGQVLPLLDVGVNFKIYRNRVSCQGECPSAGPAATTYLLDAGILARPLEGEPLRVAVLIAHLGPRLQYINAEQADPLVTRLRVAAAYELLSRFLSREAMHLWATVEVEDRIRDFGSPLVYLGGEFSAGRGDQVVARAGYGIGQSGLSAGLAVGLGLVYRQFEIGIGKTLATTALLDEGEPAQITFGVMF